MPFMTRGMTLNQKVLMLREEAFDLMTEGLDLLIDKFDDPVAFDIKKRVLARK